MAPRQRGEYEPCKCYPNCFYFKGWLKKSNEPEANAKKKIFLNRSSSWKKRYVVLLRESEDNQDVAVIAVFDKDVACNFKKPRASLKLSPWYRVDKKYDPTGKQHIFEIRTSKSTWRFLADSQTVMDLWVFYLQIQTKLRTDFPGRCFEVSPDDSESMRRIGARASQCLLHLSKWGLTLALKRTRSLVGQWPLKCIREFESSETGRFSFKAGRSSPMGSADYVFATVLGQDGEIYDLLDAYTTEDSSSQPQNQSSQASAEVVNQDYERLRLATFGLLPRRGSEGRPTSPNHTQHSQAVPVPGRVKNYDRLDRSRDGSNHKLDRSKSDNVKRTQAAPPVPSRTPSLPPKTSSPPSASSSLTTESEYNLPYAEMGGRTVEEESLPYTEMGSGSTLKRQGFGRDSKDRMSWDLPIPRTLTQSTAASDRSSYQCMDYTPQSYRNTLTQSYENTPLISPSPQARGMSNGAFVNSPLQSAMTELTIQDHDYHMVESTLGATPGNGSGPPSPLVHTYFEGEFTGSKGSSAEREHYYQGVDYEGVAPESSMLRTSSLGNLRSPTSITDSYIDRSPNLGSLDLAFSFSPANMPPNWMNDRQLPSLPRNEGLPTEENPYVVSPKKSRYAYEDVNNIFPPTPAQGAQQTDYESVSNTSAEEINVENHVLRQSTFSEGYIDSNLARSRTSESFQPNTARLVMQDSAHTAHTAVVEPGVMYAQVVATVPAAEVEPKEEKRKSFKARTLDRVKMKKSKSLVDLSVANKSPERRSIALEDLEKKKESSTLGRPKKMKKSQSIPNLVSEQTPSAPEATPQFISVKKGSDKQSPVTGVRRKFGLGLKIMRQKSKSQDEDGGDSPGKPKPLPRKIDIKGISTTDKTKSYTRKSQGQLNDLPLDGGVESKIKQGKGAMMGKRQRAVSAGNAMSVQSMLNEQSNSTGMISNPLAFRSQSFGGSVDEPALDEQGYLSPSEIGSPIKMISDPLEADMSDRPLPERPLPSPPSHSQSAPLMKVRDVKVTQVWEL